MIDAQWQATTFTAFPANLGVRLHAVLFVRHVLQPSDMGTIQGLLHGNMNHPGSGCCSVPVLLARRDPHRVPSLDLPDRPAPGLHAPNAQDHMKRLSEWVSMPCCSGTGLKRDTVRPNSGGGRGVDDGVMPNPSRERIGRSLLRRERPCNVDIHGAVFLSSGCVRDA